MLGRSKELRVFFPWERKRGFLGTLGRTRARQVLFAVAIVGLVWITRGREEHAAAVRQTRATLTTAYFAVAAYRADHGGACPKSLGELVSGAYARHLPKDAWGKPLRLVCPGRRDTAGFDLSSDGPDGIAFGLDRVE